MHAFNGPTGVYTLRATRTLALAAIALALAACAAPQAPASKAVYDFGPATNVAPEATQARSAPVALAEIEASLALDSTAVQYRLGYANAQELRPYTLARWSMPPAQLVQQRVRSALAARGPVLAPGEGSPAHTLKLELEEFSQQFDAPGTSQGVVLLHVTLLKGAALVAQTTISAQAPAPTADASGGVRALTDATDEAAAKLVAWTAQHMQ